MIVELKMKEKDNNTIDKLVLEGKKRREFMRNFSKNSKTNKKNQETYHTLISAKADGKAENIKGYWPLDRNIIYPLKQVRSSRVEQ